MRSRNLSLMGILLLIACVPANSKNASANHSVKPSNTALVQYYLTSQAAFSSPMVLSQGVAWQAVTQPLESEVAIFVDPQVRYQSFLGIGGAITDATAEVFAKLPKNRQEEFLRAYFDDKQGIGYDLVRTTIHSSDFSPYSYTYVQENDDKLNSFSIAHDLQARIPMIIRANNAAGQKLKIFASPWSAPAFMKDNKSMLKGGKLLPEYNDTWADYFVKFIQSYEKAGVPIWGLTVQNEPMAVQRWESMIFSAEDELNFLKNHLGPTLKKNNFGDKKIIIWDHNRDLVLHRASAILKDKDAAQYIWGVGFHWYEVWKGGNSMYQNVAEAKRLFPAAHFLLTEASVEKFNAEQILSWKNAERYALEMITDFNAGAEAWIDWNILLDSEGGPNHVGNFCFSPVHADASYKNLTYSPSYYYIGHFSKFIHPSVLSALAPQVATADCLPLPS